MSHPLIKKYLQSRYDDSPESLINQITQSILRENPHLKLGDFLYPTNDKYVLHGKCAPRQLKAFEIPENAIKISRQIPHQPREYPQRPSVYNRQKYLLGGDSSQFANFPDHGHVYLHPSEISLPFESLLLQEIGSTIMVQDTEYEYSPLVVTQELLDEHAIVEFTYYLSDDDSGKSTF